MKNKAFLLALSVFICSGCTSDMNDPGDCGALGDLADNNELCQCTAPNDDFNRGSLNQKNEETTMLASCANILAKEDKQPDANSRYVCLSYQCSTKRCPAGKVASSDHLSCIDKADNPVSCDAEKEIADGDSCKCDASKGYVGTAGSCKLTGECGENMALGSSNICQCTAEDDGIGNADSHNQKDGSTHLEFCSKFNEEISFDARYICVDYACQTARCPEGQKPTADKSACEPIVCSSNKYIIDDEKKACVCDYANKCTTHGSSDSCVCDASKGWIDGIDDNCVCDVANGWTGDGQGGCFCDPNKGYVLFAGLCVENPNCDAEKEIYNPTTNRCDCNEKAGYYHRNDVGICALGCKENEGPFNGKCYKVGDELQFGNYPQTSADAAPEPIDWIVLEASSDDLFILSKYGLDAKPYNKENENITWAESTIRSWLNGYDASKNKDQQDYSKNAGDSFIRRAFNNDEIAMIKEVTIENPDAPEDWNGTEGGASTKDKIFFLTFDDAESKYFKEDSERIVRATPYAVAKGVYKYTNDCRTSQSANVQYCVALWWLRSPGGIPSGAVLVGEDGSLYDDYVHSADVSSRPALHLNLNL